MAYESTGFTRVMS